MASSASIPKKLKKKNLPKFELDVYSKIAPSHLVVYSAYFLQEHGIAITVEEVVSVSFRLFPQSFSLKNYQRWPDSALVLRRLTDCREKGFLKGNSLEGFTLKFRGQKLAERTAKALGLIKPVAKKKKQAVVVPAVKKVKPVQKKKIAVAPTKKKIVIAPKVEVHAVVQKIDLPKKVTRQVVKKTPVQVKKQVSKQKPAAPKKIITSHLKNTALKDSKGTLPRKHETLRSRKALPQSDTPVQVEKQVVAQKIVSPKKTIKQAEKKSFVPVKPVVVQAEKKIIKQKPVQPKKVTKQVVKKTPVPVKPVVVQVEKQVVKKQVVQAPVVKKAAPKLKPEKIQVQKKRRVQKAQPTQFALLPPAVEIKPEPKPVVAQPVKQKKAVAQVKKMQAVQPEMTIPVVVKVEKPVAVPVVSKEEKAKAHQLVRAMEKSGAYRLYKRFGEKAKISQFDFRDMLFCTMESSAETLARNVNLFKGYARLHDRLDLVTFLNFCETYFADLLKPSAKKAGRKK